MLSMREAWLPSLHRLGIAARGCNPSTWKVKARGSKFKVIVVVPTAEIKHQDHKRAGEGKVCFICTSTSQPPPSKEEVGAET